MKQSKGTEKPKPCGVKASFTLLRAMGFLDDTVLTVMMTPCYLWCSFMHYGMHTCIELDLSSPISRGCSLWERSLVQLVKSV